MDASLAEEKSGAGTHIGINQLASMLDSKLDKFKIREKDKLRRRNPRGRSKFVPQQASEQETPILHIA